MPHRLRPVLYVKTWEDGDPVTAGDLNEQGRNHINFLTNRIPHAQVENRQLTGSAQSIANNTWTDIKLENVLRDTESGFNTQGQYTCQISGWYYVMGGAVWSDNATGARGVRFAINNFSHISGAQIKRSTAAVACGVNLTRMIPLIEGQVLTIQGWQNSGAALTLKTTEPEISFLDIMFYSQFFGLTV